MKRNVYDFDGTIYRGDSTADFYRYCIARKPSILFDLLAVGASFAAMGLGLLEKTRAKQRFYHFLSYLPDTQAYVDDFWKTRHTRIKGWYLAQKSPDDLIISASPEFLLRPICQSLGVELLASRVDPTSGKTEGRNCHDIEKVFRMHEAYPETEIAAFYSDSLADTPLARLADAAWLVHGDRITPFPLD